MSKIRHLRIVLSVVALSLAGLGAWYTVHALTGPEQASQDGPTATSTAGIRAAKARESPADALDSRFATHVQPFLQHYCLSCHAGKKPKGSLDLSRDATVAAVAKNVQRWERVLERLQA